MPAPFIPRRLTHTEGGKEITDHRERQRGGKGEERERERGEGETGMGTGTILLKACPRDRKLFPHSLQDTPLACLHISFPGPSHKKGEGRNMTADLPQTQSERGE